MRVIAVVLATLGSCPSRPAPAPASHPSQPLMAVSDCRIVFPVALRCIGEEQSPGEPYLLREERDLEVVFKRAEGTASLVRSTDPHAARVSRRTGVRDTIVHNGSFSL